MTDLSTTFPKLAEFIEEFQELDENERLQTLVELADELPPISADRAAEPLPTACRVQECQTPVHLWVDWAGNHLHLEADVPEKSPTVRGLVALVVQSLEGATAAQVLSLPDDWLPMLGLAATLGMTRQQGLRGVIRRIKQETHRQLAPL
ncbi:MAG: SufE family protein [Planctomycetaceae bacterium]|nr:SufE family protein [Planctomycetaceae bacterium]